MSQEFATGATMGLIFAGAMCGSWIFRNLILALAAGAMVMAFMNGDGVTGLMTVSGQVVRQFNLHPEFGRGAIVGVLAAIIIGGVLLSRRSG